jgi:gamma-glutamyl-gamma-aminobutyrate hydrolase PuuD
MPPLIGISSWRGSAPAEGFDVPHLLTQTSYLRAVEKAGGLAVVLPQLEPDDAGALLERVDGVVLVGGPDVDPAHYDELPDPATDVAPAGRDEFDIALARGCVERNVPMLAICRGVQVLNVALGGSLDQHRPEHMVVDQYNQDVHEVEVVTGTRWSNVFAGDRFGVNSMHHQALRTLGSDVRAIAHADDGTIEAIEVEGADHVLGVQWHPELLRHRREHLALFGWLATTAANHAR